ncbi:hypothetical protein B484DRAFT_443338 [Ochromonadaceae sp. CCMP2298]|nr:hypothetical protein B484DRAFT_443338 [Ochromonadaceae sp. CCMP2298]
MIAPPSTEISSITLSRPRSTRPLSAACWSRLAAPSPRGYICRVLMAPPTPPP